jgi:hypothetical protein
MPCSSSKCQACSHPSQRQQPTLSPLSTDAIVRLDTSPPQVRFDPDIVGVRTLLRLVENDLGYPARLDDGDDSGGGGGGGGGNDAAEVDRRFWLRRFAWGALFAVPTFLLAMVR